MPDCPSARQRQTEANSSCRSSLILLSQCHRAQGRGQEDQEEGEEQEEEEEEEEERARAGAVGGEPREEEPVLTRSPESADQTSGLSLGCVPVIWGDIFSFTPGSSEGQRERERKRGRERER